MKKDNIIKEKIGGMALFNGLILRSSKKEVISNLNDSLIEISTNSYGNDRLKFSFNKFPVIRGIIGVIKILKNSVSYVINSAKSVINEIVSSDEDVNIGSFEILISYIVAGITVLSTLIIIPNIISLFFGYNTRNIVQALIQILIFVIYLVVLRKTELLKVLFEYHGAEHKVVNAYENYEFDDISISNVQKSSRFHIRCGGNLIVYFFIINILFTIFFPSNSLIIKSIFQSIFMILSIGIAYEILMIFSKLPKTLSLVAYPAMLIQYITTREPSDEKIKLALFNMMNCAYSDKEISISRYLKDFSLTKNYDMNIVVTLVSSLKNIDYNYVYANINEIKLNVNEVLELDNMLTRLYIKNIPLQYITSYQNFFNERYFVNESVLIPRADTEILVEKAIEYIDKYNLKDMIDMCTGSGCVGISTAKNSTIEDVVLVDISEKALIVTNRNINENEASTKCHTLNSDLFSSFNNSNNECIKKYDIIVSNPPYIPTSDINTLSEEVKKEPILALDGGKDGMNFYKRILFDSKAILKDDGFLMFEIGYDELEKMTNLINNDSSYELIESLKDYSRK